MKRCILLLISALALAVHFSPTAWSTPPPPDIALTPPVPGEVATSFDGGTGPYSAGHRGVDLRAADGAEITASAPGTIRFVGEVAGTPYVSIDHGNGIRTTYSPITSRVKKGDTVATGDVIGTVAEGSTHCKPEACLHWGLTDGTTYWDPMTKVSSHSASGQSAGSLRLLPEGSLPTPMPNPEDAVVAGPFPAGSGNLPAPGRVSSPFGYRSDPFNGTRVFHDGVDIAAPCGTPITLPRGGVVVRAEFNLGGFGNWVIVDHGDGTRSGYAHLHNLPMRVGEVVQAGDTRLQIGTTGRSTGCHLHWSKWVNGKVVDPMG